MSTIILQEQAQSTFYRWKSAHSLLKPSILYSMYWTQTDPEPSLPRPATRCLITVEAIKAAGRSAQSEPRRFHNTVHMFVRRLWSPQQGTLRFPCRSGWVRGGWGWGGLYGLRVGLSSTEVVETNLQSGSRCQARGIQIHPYHPSTHCGNVVPCTHTHTHWGRGIMKSVCRLVFLWVSIYLNICVRAKFVCVCSSVCRLVCVCV